MIEHIGNIYKEGELDENSTCRKFRQVWKEENRKAAGELPALKDIGIAKNYLEESELKVYLKSIKEVSKNVKRR